MDARYFQVQLRAVLVNFLLLVHQEDMSPKSMSGKEVSEASLVHGFGVPDLYPERVYDDSHDEGYEVRETYAQCEVLSNKVCLVC